MTDRSSDDTGDIPLRQEPQGSGIEVGEGVAPPHLPGQEELPRSDQRHPSSTAPEVVATTRHRPQGLALLNPSVPSDPSQLQQQPEAQSPSTGSSFGCPSTIPLYSFL
ncbi:hypothetical protein VTI74DRAFT_4232 [Chaetomium olivicolor]